MTVGVGVATGPTTTAADMRDGALVPTALVAVTRNVYEVPV